MILSTDIEIFINRSQQKIASIGDSMLLQDIQGLCIENSISLIEELSAAVDLFQNSCCQPNENLSYKIIGYLNDKADMAILPIAIFDNNCLVDAVLLPSGGFVEGPQGPPGLAATITIGTTIGLPAGNIPTISNSGTNSAAIFNFGIPAGADGINGNNGTNGWSPIYGLVTDGFRKVIQLTGWTGGTGIPPAIIGVYIGTTGYVTLISDAVDISGPSGADGANGDNGFDGWTPILAVVSDGERRVLQVISWTGGSGTPPSSGLYVSNSGFTADISAATDIRGDIGAQGEPFTIDAAGNLSDRNGYDNESAGFTFLAYDTGDVYIKNSSLPGDWGPPISFVGDKGWSPVLNTVADGERIVLQVSDWIGGQGLKPSSGDYVSPLGFTNNITDATDIRGDRGEFFIDAQGPLSDRSGFDNQNRPYVYYAQDNGKIYFKNSDSSGDWTTGFDWRGERGAPGIIGANGENAFTITTGVFTMPSIGSNVNVSVINTDWMATGQVLYITNAGYFQIITIVSTNTVTLNNLGYNGNASPSTVISASQNVSAGGLKGADGTIDALVQGTNILTEDLIFDLVSSFEFKISNGNLNLDGNNIKNISTISDLLNNEIFNIDLKEIKNSNGDIVESWDTDVLGVRLFGLSGVAIKTYERQLIGANGNVRLTWDDCIFFDTDADISLDFDTRILKNKSGTDVMMWDVSSLSGDWFTNGNFSITDNTKYFGIDIANNGGWRHGVDGSDYVFYRKESGIWVEKSRISAS